MFKINVDLGQIREAGWPLILGATAAAIAFTTLAVYFVIGPELLMPLWEATGGWLHPTLIINVVLMALVVVGLLFVIGRLHPRDVGLKLGDVRVGVLVTVGVWAASQVVGLVISLVQSGSIRFDTVWHEYGAGIILGSLIAQVFGNALYEEIVYRGFLFNQVLIKMRRRFVERPRLAIAAGLLISQTLFALMHIPIRLIYGVPAAQLPLILILPLVLGVFFALLYYRTGNLFIAVGLHALNNSPVALFASQGLATGVILGLSLLLMIVWPRLAGQPTARRVLRAT